MGPLPVVCEEEETKAVKIEAAHRIDPGRDIIQVLGHHRASFRVMKSGDDPERLVEHKIQSLGRPRNDPSVNAYVILTPPNRQPWLRDEAAVNTNTALSDPFIRFPSRRQAGQGEDSIDPDRLWCFW